jgi:hypothetical protein
MAASRCNTTREPFGKQLNANKKSRRRLNLLSGARSYILGIVRNGGSQFVCPRARQQCSLCFVGLLMNTHTAPANALVPCDGFYNLRVIVLIQSTAHRCTGTGLTSTRGTRGK